MPLSRKQIGQIFRPVGPKAVSLGVTGTGFAAASLGGSALLAQQLDLSLPIRGLRLVVKGRLVVGTAAFTTTFPESFLGTISNIQVFGTNSRQRGNATLYNIDLATLWMIQHHFDFREAQFDISTGGGAATEVAVPDTPMPTFLTLNTGTYDYRIVVDLPFYPFASGGGVIPQFLMRQEEWGSSPTIQITWGTQAGNATGCLGVAAATTTCTWSAYGSGAGQPSVDIYSLPMVMGLDLKDGVVPGFLTRIQQQLTSVLQSAGGASTRLLLLQKQPTTRVFAKFGTSTIPNGNPAFATLSDTNVTTLGITLGGNRNVRNNVDIFAHKQELVERYPHGPIQGYNCLDFVSSGSPDSAYPGDQVGDGTTFELDGTVAGVANGFGIVIQEQMLYAGEGPLYSF